MAWSSGRWALLAAAVALAAAPAAAGENALTSVTYTRTPHLTIPDDGPPVTDGVAVDLSAIVDSIRVYIDVSITYNSDLTIKLQSPTGTWRYVVFVDSGIPDPNIPGLWFPGDWEPWQDLNAFDGETTAGTWNLICQDLSYDSEGILNEWRLQIFYDDTATDESAVGELKARYK